MSRQVCLLVNTIEFPQGGGHFWVFLNWALGLQANGCRVLWMEPLPPHFGPRQLDDHLALLRSRLRPYGLDQGLALFAWSDDDPVGDVPEGVIDLAQAAEGSDLALNFAYNVPASVIGRFRRSAMIDIDPGLTQLWMAAGQMPIAAHTHYFTTGESVGSNPRIPDCGLPWQYTPPCVSLQAWPVVAAAPGAAFTTVSQWYTSDWVDGPDGVYANSKRQGFMRFLDLPHATAQPLELALALGEGAYAERERRNLQQRGWRIRNAWEVASSPDDYRRYIQRSLGEFSCVKPSCVRLRNAWISDRTLCYLASGKPVVVRDTGASRFLPRRAGLLRFRTRREAASMLDEAAADYALHSRQARALAESHFDATQVTRRLLERALP